MENKTAMQLHIQKIDAFIDYVKNHESQSSANENLIKIYNSLKDNATKLLEKEKKDMENAFHAGFFIHEWDKRKENKFEQYYNKTFKNK